MRNWIKYFRQAARPKNPDRSSSFSHLQSLAIVPQETKPSEENDEDRFHRKYSLGEAIGRGGFGTVYSATRKKDSKIVAVKFLELSAINEWDVVNKRLVPMEIGLLKRCNGVSGVIKLIDWFQVSTGYLIVMERPMPAIDLFDYLTMLGSMQENLARYYFRQDENIIIDILHGKIRLIDFGSGALLRNGPYTDFEGTRPCTPPEYLVQGTYYAVPQTVWSLGILLYTMVCGDYPFHNDLEIVERKVIFKRRLSKRIPYTVYPIVPACRQLIRACLRKNPWERPGIEHLLSHKWFSSSAILMTNTKPPPKVNIPQQFGGASRQVHQQAGGRSVVNLFQSRLRPPRSLSPLTSLSSTTTASFDRQMIRHR